jgi:membrane-associated phospholipid phosphatase
VPGLARQLTRWLLIALTGTAAVIGVGLGLRALTAGLGSWDGRELDAIVGGRGRAAIDAAHAASLFGRSWALLAIAAAAGLGRRGGSAMARLLPVTAVLVAIIAQNVIKTIVRRPRPPVRHLEHVTSWSFPSGHATESTALLGALVIASWSRGSSRARMAIVVGAAAVEAAIAGSRLVLGVHYPTDVMAGIVLGVLAAAVARLACAP